MTAWVLVHKWYILGKKNSIEFNQIDLTRRHLEMTAAVAVAAAEIKRSNRINSQIHRNRPQSFYKNLPWNKCCPCTIVNNCERFSEWQPTNKRHNHHFPFKNCANIEFNAMQFVLVVFMCLFVEFRVLLNIYNLNWTSIWGLFGYKTIIASLFIFSLPFSQMFFLLFCICIQPNQKKQFPIL